MRVLLLTSLLASVFLSGAALAEHHGKEGAQPHDGPEEYGKRGKFGRNMGPGHRPRGEMALKKIDVNGDGQVDLEEYMNNARERFTEMDLNGDNLVTTEEAREAGDAMREKHREAMKVARKAYKESKQAKESKKAKDVE